MLFLIHYEVKPELRDAGHERIRKVGIKVPETMKLVAAYHSVTQLEGWAVVEATDDATKLWEFFEGWTDLNINHITPVLDNETMKSIV